MQAQFKKIMNTKMKILKNKWKSYDRKAKDHQEKYITTFQIQTPTFEEVKAMDLNNSFWNTASLFHPNEPWAFDRNIQVGIEEMLKATHCQDDLHRIAREARQAIKWAIEKSTCLDNILKILGQGLLI